MSILPTLGMAQDQTLDASLSLTPQRCIALREGQTCYLDITINWQTQHIGDYCLHEPSVQKPLFCWKARRQGQIVIAFEGENDTEYMLIDNQGQPRATARVSVAWVYKRNVERESTWRLF